MREDYDVEPDEDDDEDQDPLEEEGSAPAKFPSDEETDREEDEAEAEHERRRPAAGAPAPAAVAGPDPSADGLFNLLPASYQNAVRAGALTTVQAFQRAQENQRQHLSRIHGEAERARSEAAAARQEAAGATAKMAARVEKLMAAFGVEDPAGGGAKKLPTLEEDAPGHLAGRLDEIQRELEQGRLDASTAEAQRAHAAEIDGMRGSVEAHVSADYEAAIEHLPDYDEAEAFLVNRVFAGEVLRLSELHPGATQQQIEATAQQNLLSISAELQIQAAAKGVSLAAEVYKAARANGYGHQAARAQAAAAPPPPAAPSPGQRRMAAARERQASASTIAGTAPRVSGRTDEQLITEILNFTDDEFDELFDGDDDYQADRRFKTILRQVSV